MLVNTSYFVGPLSIAQLGQKAVEDRLNDFINLWEPRIMEAALGYDFYHAFLTGINTDYPEQRWLDILNGVVFADIAGFKKRFLGFGGSRIVEGSNGVTLTQRDDLTIYAGVTAGFSIGGNSYTDPDLLGWKFNFELFGAGTLEFGVEWNYKDGGGIQLTDGAYQTQPNERWVLHFKGGKNTSAAQVIQNPTYPYSPIAGFVFYEFMSDGFYQRTGIGAVKAKSENTEGGNPAFMLANAYNDAIKQINIFWDFLQVKTQGDNNIYPEFNYVQLYGYGFGSWYNRGFSPNFDNGPYTFGYMNPLF